MTRDDIIRMARNEYGIYAFTADSLTEFANLVAAAEREECARICSELWAIDGTHIAQQFAAAIRNRVDV